MTLRATIPFQAGILSALDTNGIDKRRKSHDTAWALTLTLPILPWAYSALSYPDPILPYPALSYPTLSCPILSYPALAYPDRKSVV